MNGVPGLTPKLLKRFSELLLAAVRRGQALPDERLPRYPRSKGEPNPGIKSRIARIKTWREHLSGQLQLAPGLVAPNWLLERIAEQQPTDLAQLAAVSGIRRWQLDLWGADMLKILTKERQTV